MALDIQPRLPSLDVQPHSNSTDSRPRTGAAKAVLDIFEPPEKPDIRPRAMTGLDIRPGEDPDMPPRAAQKLDIRPAASGGGGDIAARLGKEVIQGASSGAQDVLGTYIQLRDAVHSPSAAARQVSLPDQALGWLKAYTPAPPPPGKTTGGKVADIGAYALGGLPAGMIEWVQGTPFALAHGVKTAKDQAAAQGRKATWGEEIKDALVEGVARKFLGHVSDQPIGRVTTGLAFGGTAGVQDLAENRDAGQSGIDAAVSALVGVIAPSLSGKDRARIEAAKQSADPAAARQAVTEVLRHHSTVFADAARNLGVDARVGDQPTAGSWQDLTAASDKDIAATTDAALATRITRRELDDTRAREALGETENAFKGVADMDRISMMAGYQTGGLEAVPEAYRPAFETVERVLGEEAGEDNKAGLEYELRANYLPGLYRDEAGAGKFFGANPYGGTRFGKPGFTKAKVYNDYLEAFEAGLIPKSTNPAVLAAWRAEAGARARMRLGAMRDAVEDGTAVPLDQAQYRDAGGAVRTPDEYGKWVPMDVGGSRYLVHPAAARLMKRALNIDQLSLGKLLESTLGVDPNGRAARVAGGLGRAWMAARNATIPTVLSLSSFHAFHELGIQSVQHINEALAQSLNRKLTLGEFLKAVRAGGDISEGLRLTGLFKKPDKTLTPDERLDVNLFLAGGMNPTRPSVYETRAEENWRRTFNDVIPTLRQEAAGANLGALAAAWKVTPEYARAAALSIGRVAEAMQGPMFKVWIPAMKAMAYKNDAVTVLTAHPELLAGTPAANAALRRALRQVAQNVDDRFGEMQYDKVFMPQLMKKSLMGAFLSVGWNYGFFRQFGGAVHDTLGAAKTREITSRMVYASAYTLQALLMGGMMTYLFTGQPPQGMKDLIYPREANGNRFNTMFFTREFGGMYYHLAQEGVFGGASSFVLSKMAPLANSFREALEGVDYYGNQIVDPNAGIFTQVAQGMEHLGVGLAPISVQNSVAGNERSPPEIAMGLGGFSQAPKYVDRPAIQGRILRAFDRQHPQAVTPYAEVGRHDDLRAAKQAFQAFQKSHDPQDKQRYQEAIAAYEKKYPERLGRGGRALKEMMRSWAQPDGAAQFQQLDRATQLAILKDAAAEDRAAYLRFAHPDVRAQFGATK